MPELESTQFGMLRYDEDAVIEFPAGLPAFEQEHHFVLVERAETAPVVFLHSLRRPDLCFVTLPVHAIDPAYRLKVLAEDLAALGLDPARQPEIGADVICLVLITIPASRKPTANLMAPIVIRKLTRQALQAVQIDTEYSHQQPLYVPEEEPACS